MATHGGAVESRELRELYQNRRTNRGPQQHRADGRGGDNESTLDNRERRILAGRHRTSSDNGNQREIARPLRTRDALALVDGSNPQDDADAGGATRGASAGNAAEGAPAGWRGRRRCD